MPTLMTMTVSTGIAMLAVGSGLGDGGRNLSFAWLLNAWFAISICLGALFFVGIQHITRSGWSVTLRRGAEILGASIVGPLLLLIPILLLLLNGSGLLFPWNDVSVVTGDKVLESKQAFLNAPFFVMRTLVYAAMWIGAGIWLLRTSRRQDQTSSPHLTLLMERRSAPILIGLALTTTFAAFDWLMSLDPHWFSTIYGVYVFSGGMVGALAVLSIGAAMAVRSQSTDVTSEHLHDITKLLFGFNCFWAYIAFSQYLLIWYANIPEETVWIIDRQQHRWNLVTLTLVFGHFVIPFLVLMPRAVKRNTSLVIAISLLLLGMHWLDLYWLVYPQLSASPVIGATEFLGLIFVFGVTAISVRRFVKDGNLIPVNDPRLPESVSHHVA